MGTCGNNCTSWQDGGPEPRYQADPDIAGIGNIMVFVVSAGLVLFLSLAHLIFTISDTQDENRVDMFLHRALTGIGFSIGAGRKRDFWVPVIEKVVLSLSDQQLLTGLAVLIAGFWTHCSISVYHFALVNDLAWFSATTHLTTLNVLQDFFRQNSVLRTSRVILMVVMGILLLASNVMEGHYAWFDSWPYDAQCLFDNLIGNIGGGPCYFMSVNIAMLFVFYSWGIIALYERPSRFSKDLLGKPKEAQKEAIQHLQRKKANLDPPSSSESSRKRTSFTLLIALVNIVRWIYLLLIAIVSSRACNLALDFGLFGYSVWSLMNDRKVPASRMDGNENAMSFGQIMPILLLSSILLVCREAYDDQKERTHETRLSRSNSSHIRLVRTRDSMAVSSIASNSFEMSGGIQDAEDNVEPEIPPPRRVDTEMGGRSHTSTFEGRVQETEGDVEPEIPPPRRVDTEMGGRSHTPTFGGQQLQRRPTYPPSPSDT